MDQHANQMDQSSIADLPHPQLPPHPHPHPQLPPYPHPLPQHQYLGPYHHAMYQHGYGPMAPPPPYHGYAPGLVPHYPSAPSTVQSQMQGYEQQLEQGPVQNATVGAAQGSSVRRAKRRRISHDEYPDFTRVDGNGEVLYKCTVLRCANVRAMKRGSIPNHITTNRHTGRVGQFICTYCGKDYSRVDSLKRHLGQHTSANVPQGPGAAPATVVVQPTIAVPQAQFSFQMVWDPRSELTSGTQQSLPSAGDATSLALSSAAPVTADEDDDNDNLESDAEDSSSGDKALDNLLNSLDWD